MDIVGENMSLWLDSLTPEERLEVGTPRPSCAGMTKDDYANGAKNLFESACGVDILGHMDTNYNIVRFNKATGEFTKGHVNKGLFTYFKVKIDEGLPAALRYYKKTKLRDEREIEDGKVVCPICGKYEFAMYADFDICPVCGWENDGVQMDYPDEKQGANWLSVNQARKYWEFTSQRLIKCPVCDTPAFKEDRDYCHCRVCGWGNDVHSKWVDNPNDPEGDSGMNVCNLRLYKRLWKKYWSKEQKIDILPMQCPV